MKPLLTVITLLICLSASAQKADVAIGKAVYTFTHIRDTTNRNKPYTERLILLVGRNASVYKSLDKQLAEEKLNKQVADQVKSASNPNAISLNISGSQPTQVEEYYQYPKDKKLYTEENIINYYLAEEPLPVIKWTIKPDTISFGALHCQMATTHFKGRDYTAWFCPDLPFQTGPWKLNGLPGLILEASDSKKEVIFKFDGFEDVSATQQTITPPADDIRATPEEIARLKDAQKKDPQGFRKASHGSGQAKRSKGAMDLVDVSKIASINVQGYSGPITKVINNPIELPEGK